MSSPSIGVFYGSDTGNTQRVAELICEELKPLEIEAKDIDECSVEDMLAPDVIMMGVSTWDIGHIQYSWEDKLEDLAKADLAGKKVAIFGLGDSVGYPDTFVDGMGILWESLGQERPEIVGVWPTEEYEFDDSRGKFDDDNFLGLVIDEDSEPDKTEDRVKRWAAKLKQELELDA
ncbi:MAG: flavodoxin [Planctomycetota bacterium]